MPFDTAGKPDQAVVGLRKLAEDDKVIAIIGPFSSSECRVAFPAAEREGVPTMSMASSAPKLAEPFTYAFRNTSDEGYLFTRVMRALKEHNLPVATAALAYATDDVVSKTMGEIVLPNVMKKAGTDIKLSVTFQTQAFDLAPQVSQLVANPTDLIGVGSGPEPATRLAQELRRQGGKGRLVAGSTIADPELPRLMGTAGDGTTIPTAFYSGLDDRTKKFEAEFIDKAKAAGIDRSRGGAIRCRDLRYRAHLRASDEDSERDRRSGQTCCGAHRHSRRDSQDEGLSRFGRADFVRIERRRAQTRLHNRNEGRQVESAGPLSGERLTACATTSREMTCNPQKSSTSIGSERSSLPAGPGATLRLWKSIFANSKRSA